MRSSGANDGPAPVKELCKQRDLNVKSPRAGGRGGGLRSSKEKELNRQDAKAAKKNKTRENRTRQNNTKLNNQIKATAH
jgi:hypothetical protein